MELRGTHKSKAEKEGGGWWGKKALPCGIRVREATAEKGHIRSEGSEELNHGHVFPGIGNRECKGPEDRVWVNCLEARGCGV